MGLLVHGLQVLLDFEVLDVFRAKLPVFWLKVVFSESVNKEPDRAKETASTSPTTLNQM